MKHNSKSNHAHVLMSGHNPEHHHKEHRSHGEHGGSSNAKPSDILMRQHHFHGGIASSAPVYAEGGSATKKNRFATGGHVDHESKGGRPRKRHADGGSTMDVNDEVYPFKAGLARRGPFKKGGHCYAEGGETKEYGEKPLTGQLRRGGMATQRRSRHSDGEAVEGDPVADNSVREERRKGGSAKRQHHYWGQNFIGRLPLIGGLANSISNTVGTLDPHKYGGAEYVAKTKGQKAADIFSTIGNLGANVALSAVGKKSKGGEVHHRAHHAAGGSGKVRKGMMTKSGRMIHSDI